jgi:holin-like protein
MNALRGFAVLLGLQLGGELLARWGGLPLPGPVLGFLLLMPLLGVAAVRSWVAPAADTLLTHLSLLFVPVGVGVVVHLGPLGAMGWRIALALVLSTWIGIAVTALVLRTLWHRRPPGDGRAGGEAS